MELPKNMRPSMQEQPQQKTLKDLEKEQPATSTQNAEPDLPPMLSEAGAINSVALSFMQKQSGIETVGMAYYKIADEVPDMRGWAAKTRSVMETPDYDRADALTTEFNRLQNKYVNFDPETPIVINGVIDLSQYSEKKETLFLDNFHKNVYFPYDVYGQPIAVLVRDIHMFKELPISGREWAQIKEVMGENTRAVVQMTTIPKLADHSRTLVLSTKDQTEYHPLLVEPAQFSIWTPGDYAKALWMWRANWFKPKQDRELLKLYGTQ